MKKISILFLCILICIGCGSKSKFSGEIKIHFNDHQKSKTTNKQIIETRLERLKVRSFTIEELSDGFLIKLQTSDTNRIIQMLEINEKLGFWETYENAEVYPWLENLDKKIASEMLPDSTKDSVEILHPLFYRLQFNFYVGGDNLQYLSKGSIIGYAAEKDKNLIDSLMKIGISKSLFPNKMILMWAQPTDKGIFPLCALKQDDFTKGPFMGSKEIKSTDLTESIKETPALLLRLTNEGSRMFQTFTSKNTGREIAITYGSSVIMHPVVQSEIEGGLVEISGPSSEFMKFLQYALQMPAYTSSPVSITHHFELRK